MFRRLLLGLLKGVAIGGAIGALFQFALHIPVLSVGVLTYMLYGAVASLAGVIAGQPPWREGAWVASILKAIFGFGVGAGLYWLGARFLSVVDVGGLAGLPAHAPLSQVPLLFAPMVAAVYSTLVELDDGGPAAPAEKKTGVRVDAADEAEAEEQPSERAQKPAQKSRKA